MKIVKLISLRFLMSYFVFHSKIRHIQTICKIFNFSSVEARSDFYQTQTIRSARVCMSAAWTIKMSSGWTSQWKHCFQRRKRKKVLWLAVSAECTHCDNTHRMHAGRKKTIYALEYYVVSDTSHAQNLKKIVECDSWHSCDYSGMRNIPITFQEVCKLQCQKYVTNS